jgi:hypothetical protein
VEGVMADHFRVIELLQDLGNETVPRGFQGSLFTTIDEMIDAGAPAEQIRLASALSVAVHKYGWAVFNRDGTAQEATRQQLNELSARLLNAINEPSN